MGAQIKTKGVDRKIGKEEKRKRKKRKRLGF
jgi:hypothetical protein